MNKLFFVPTVFWLSNCSLPNSPDAAAGDRIFFASFESARDTAGWTGYGFRIVNESAPKGGERSVQIAGGCIHPHAVVELGRAPRNGVVTLNLWGRNLALGGGVSLYRTNTSSERINISVTDSTWRSYSSSKGLDCQAGDKLTLEMFAGGFVYSAMLVDLLEVRWEK